MRGTVYILKNNEGRYYIGSTNNLNRRLKQHSRGHTQTTNFRKMHELVFIQHFDTLAYARKVELWLKKLKRKNYIEKIVRDGYIKKAVR